MAHRGPPASPAGGVPPGRYAEGLQQSAGNAAVAAALQTGAPVVATGRPVQGQEAPAPRPSLPADVNVGFNPMDVAHQLIDAIDQGEVQASTGGFFGHLLPPSEWRRHINFPKVASLLSHLTAEQVKLVEDQYEAYEKRCLREDIFGGGESHFRSDLTKDQLDQIQAMLGGTKPAGPDSVQDAAVHQLTVDAARLHELLFGDLGEKDVEEVMSLLRRSAQGNTDLRNEYERLHVTTFFGDLGKLPIVELPRAMMLVPGNIVAADRFKVSLELSRIEAINREIAALTKPMGTLAGMSLALAESGLQGYALGQHIKDLKKERQRLVEDVTRRGQQAVVEGRREAGAEDPMAAQMAGEARASAVLGGVASAATRVGGREGEILRAVAFSDPAARVAAELRKLKESDDLKPAAIAAVLRQLRDEAETEAQRRHPQGTEEEVAVEARNLSGEYFRRLQDVWNAGVKPDELRFDALLGNTGDSTEVQISQELLAGHGHMDDVRELVLALTGDRKDIEAVKRVLYDKSASQITGLRLKYMVATGGRNLDYDLFGEGATHAGEQEKDFWTSKMVSGYLSKFGGKATGSDRLILEDYVQRPKHEGDTEEVLYLAARSEREYQYTIDNGGGTGWWRDHWGNEARSLLDATIKVVRESREQYLAKAGWQYNPFGEDRVTNEEWTRSSEAHGLLLQMRLARATIRGDRERYEKATAALREIFEMVASFVIQAALTAVLGPVAEAIFALELVEGAEAVATMTRLATWARETGVGIAATVGANAVVHGDAYSWDMFKHDVLGGLGGAVGQAAAEKFLGPIAAGFAGRLGTKCPPEIVKIAGTYGNITGAALATDEEVNLGMSNVVQTHLITKGGETITAGVNKGLGLPRHSTTLERKHPYQEGGPAREAGSPGAAEETHGTAAGRAGPAEPTVPMALPGPVVGPAAPKARATEPQVSMHLPEAGRAAPTAPERPAPEKPAPEHAPETTPASEVPPAPQQGPVHPGKWTTPSLKGTYVDRRFPKGNVRVAFDLPGFDIKAVMHELELTPWGSRIADRIRGGDVELRILQELPPGYAAAASPNEIWLEFRPSVAEMASSIIHEGTHNLDPAIATYGTPESKSSRLAMESGARAFEYEYRRERRLPPYDEAEQAYRDAYDKAYIETGDEVAANISADKAMIEAMRRHPQRYAVETPAQEQAQRERAAKAAEGIMEDIAGAPLVGVDIGPFEDIPTSPGTSRFAHEKTSPGGPAFDPALMERMQKEEQLESALYARARAAAEHRLAYEAYQQAEATAGADLRGLTARREKALAKFAAADAEVKGLEKSLQDQKMAPKPPPEAPQPEAQGKGGPPRPATTAGVRDKVRILRGKFGRDFRDRPGFDRALKKIDLLAQTNPEQALAQVKELGDALEGADVAPGQPEVMPTEREEGAPLREAASPKERSRVERRRPSTVLAEAMEPIYGPRPEGHQAHHIVAESDVKGRIARKILGLAGYDINHGLNGAYLPGPRTDVPREGQLKHSNVHTKGYYIEVTERLVTAYVEDHVEDTMKAIHWELLDSQGTLGLKTKETFADWVENNRKHLKPFLNDAEIDQLVQDATPRRR